MHSVAAPPDHSVRHVRISNHRRHALLPPSKILVRVARSDRIPPHAKLKENALEWELNRIQEETDCSDC